MLGGPVLVSIIIILNQVQYLVSLDSDKKSIPRCLPLRSLEPRRCTHAIETERRGKMRSILLVHKAYIAAIDFSRITMKNNYSWFELLPNCR